MSPGPANAEAPPAPGLAARRAALEALQAVEERDAYSNLAVPAAVAGLADARDRAFASHLAYETLRWQGTLDWALGHVLDRDLAAVEPALRRVLQLGALQLLRSSVPPAAAVSTAVQLAREAVPPARGRAASGFCNGVLRALDRQRDRLPWPDPAGDPVGHLALTTAHPRWVVQDLRTRLDPDQTRAVLEADNDAPGLTLRATRDRDALIEELRQIGVPAEPGRHAPEAVRAPGADPRRLAAVAEGRAVPQDEASMLVARATRARPGDRVLDLCAGPGGKATRLATLVQPGGRVVTLELHAHRATLVRDAAARVGVDLAVIVGDGTAPPIRGSFDVVLVDAPCTGLGAGRRRPEVRWRRTPADAHDLADLQRRLLTAAARAIRPGGHLTYAACTWTRAETDEVVAGFLAAHAVEFQPVEVVQRWPHRDGTDGMFHATLRRVADEEAR